MFVHCGSRQFATMRWIFVTFVACMAVATANLYEDDDNSYDEEQNNIDIFLPKSLNEGHLDRALRGFYSSYWLYPSMAFRSRAPYMDYNYVEPLTFQDVFEKPVLVVTPSQNAQTTFSMFYLHNGLRTLHRYQAFSWLQEYFKHPGLKGLIFYPHLIYNVRFFDTPITSVTVPEDLRMSDFVSIENCNNGRIPYMFVAPEDLFDRMHFENIAKVSDFKVYNDAIEVHPIVSQPRPVYEPFYGPHSSQGLQQHFAAPPQEHHVAPPQEHHVAPPQEHHVAPPQEHHVAPPQEHHVAPPQEHHAAPPQTSDSDSSMNTFSFRGDDDETDIEQPGMFAQSGNLVASQTGRGFYGEMEYGGQYGYGQNQGVDGQYSMNYRPEQSGLVQPERTLNVQASNSYHQEMGFGTQAGSKNGAQVDAAHGASRDVYGTLMGTDVGVQSASKSTSGAQVGVTQNAVHHQPGGQVHNYGASKDSGNINSRAEAVKPQNAHVGISRVEEININSQLSGSEGTKLTGGQLLEVSTQKTGNILRTDSGVTKGHIFGATTEGVSTVGVSGQQSVAGSMYRVESGNIAEVGSLSRANSGSQVPGQSAILFPKEGRPAGFAGAGLQGGMASGSVSRTGAQSMEHVTESQASGHSQVQSSGASLNSGNLVRTESAKFESQAGVQGGVSAAVNAGGISRTNTRGVEKVTETVASSVLTGKTGELMRTGANFGGSIGVQGGIQGSGAEIVRHHEGELERRSQQSSSISSSNSQSRSGVPNVGSSTLSGPLKVSKPAFEPSARSLVSSSRSLTEEESSSEAVA